MARTQGPLTWVTDALAVGPAPLTDAHLHFLHEQGISAILNLCAEFPLLPDRERQAGFEVYHLPIPDEGAPDLEALEKALAWLDEALYLGKKVLIHCRFGIGRTGTVLNAYFLRRGLGHRRSWWALRPLRSKPTNFAQWRAVRRYGKANPSLEADVPSLGFPSYLNLSPLLAEYQDLVAEVVGRTEMLPQCGHDHTACCRRPGDLGVAEAAFLGQYLDSHVESRHRRRAMARAAGTLRREDRLRRQHSAEAASCLVASLPCPLLVDGRCLVLAGRPVACRVWELGGEEALAWWNSRLALALEDLDRRVWELVGDGALLPSLPRFSFAEVVAGRYVARVFQLVASLAGPVASQSSGLPSGSR